MDAPQVIRPQQERSAARPSGSLPPRRSCVTRDPHAGAIPDAALGNGHLPAGYEVNQSPQRWQGVSQIVIMRPMLRLGCR